MSTKTEEILDIIKSLTLYAHSTLREEGRYGTGLQAIRFLEIASRLCDLAMDIAGDDDRKRIEEIKMRIISLSELMKMNASIAEEKLGAFLAEVLSERSSGKGARDDLRHYV